MGKLKELSKNRRGGNKMRFEIVCAKYLAEYLYNHRILGLNELVDVINSDSTVIVCKGELGNLVNRFCRKRQVQLDYRIARVENNYLVAVKKGIPL